MAHPSEHRLLVLHGLRLKGVATPDALAGLFDLDPEAVAKELDTASGEGLVRFREGAVTGWSLTPQGSAAAGAMIAEEARHADALAAVGSGYDRFLALNGAMLSACTRWQLRDGALNDHADDEYDAAVMSDLGDLHARATPIVDGLGEVLERFAGYGPRFGRALARLRSGEREWFTRPLIDSYHTVWFELHEDLLATLGRERASEGAG